MTFVHITNISAVTLLTRFWWNFKSLGSWEHHSLEHLSRQHLSWWHPSISGISQLLLTRFWWNFKGSFLGTTRTDSNYQVNICLGKIWPCKICPYLEYLSCYQNCDQKIFLLLIFRTRLFYQKLLYPKFAYDSRFLGGKNYVKIQYLVTKILSKTPVSFFLDTLYISTRKYP